MVSAKPGNELDLEKVTLRDCFDYFEVHLPKRYMMKLKDDFKYERGG